MTAIGVGRLEVEGLNKKEKGLMDMDNCVEFAGGRGSIRELNGNGKYAIKIKSTPPKMHGYFKWIVMMILFPLVKYLGNFYTHIHLVFKYIVFKSYAGVGFYKLPYTTRYSRKECVMD